MTLVLRRKSPVIVKNVKEKLDHGVVLYSGKYIGVRWSDWETEVIHAPANNGPEPSDEGDIEEITR